MEKLQLKKEYFFPCKEKIILNGDAGHAVGMAIAQNGVPTSNVDYSWNGEKCKNCTLNCKKDIVSAIYSPPSDYEIKSRPDSVLNDVITTICVCYSKEYLENKDKKTVSYLDIGGKLGNYCIEMIVQYEEYQHIFYLDGETEGCALIDFVNEHLCESMFDEFYDEDIDKYCLYMIDNETGKTKMVEFSAFTDIITQITSIRYIK